MATLFMRIEGLDPDGVGTLENLGDRTGWFLLNEFNYTVSRDISVQVGNATTSDTGSLFYSPASFSRTKDGASPYLVHYLHKPGPEGFTVHIAEVKPDRDGGTPIVVRLVTLTHARINSISSSFSNDGTATEFGSMVYTMIKEEDWIEKEGGEIVKHQTVEFDLGKAKLTSGAQV